MVSIQWLFFGPLYTSIGTTFPPPPPPRKKKREKIAGSQKKKQKKFDPNWCSFSIFLGGADGKVPIHVIHVGLEGQ